MFDSERAKSHVPSLIEAADLLERLSSAATPGLWRVETTVHQYDDGSTSRQYSIEGTERTVVEVDSDRDYGSPQGGIENWADAEYISALEPAVGKLLAEWLRVVAFQLNKGTEPTGLPYAVQIARAVLGLVNW